MARSLSGEGLAGQAGVAGEPCAVRRTVGISSPNPHTHIPTSDGADVCACRRVPMALSVKLHLNLTTVLEAARTPSPPDPTRSDDADVRAFRGVFLAAGRPCTVRCSKGDDEMAACGQLGDPGASPRPAPLLRPPEALLARLAGQRGQQQGQGEVGEAEGHGIGEAEGAVACA